MFFLYAVGEPRIPPSAASVHHHLNGSYFKWFRVEYYFILRIMYRWMWNYIISTSNPWFLELLLLSTGLSKKVYPFKGKYQVNESMTVHGFVAILKVFMRDWSTRNLRVGDSGHHLTSLFWRHLPISFLGYKQWRRTWACFDEHKCFQGTVMEGLHTEEQGGAGLWSQKGPDSSSVSDPSVSSSTPPLPVSACHAPSSPHFTV